MGVFDPPKKNSKVLPKQYQDNAMHNLSADYTGVAPRVGTGKKKGTVKVSKPSSVSSGWKPASKKTKRKR